MRIHCIRHEPFEGLAAIEEWIRAKNYHLTFTHTYISQCFPNDNSFDFLIIMGGTVDLSNDSFDPCLEEEIDFIRRSIDKNKKVLGICLGAQLIAKALGAKVYTGKYKEIGWYPIKFNLKDNPSLNFLPVTMEVFHWHGDTFDIPVGAVHLASSEVTPNQGFMLGKNVLAMQYHSEMTHDSIRKMLKAAPEEIKNGGQHIQTAEEILGSDELISNNNDLMFKILDFFTSN
ncbi:MAG: amidotransferase [Bacteroidales bacterium]|nr:amidotransferase [Bacteroidales bacterium]